MKLYANDSKILEKVDTLIERKGLQKDLDFISDWIRELVSVPESHRILTKLMS